MRRILVYVLITAAVLALPLERTDVADLRPVQTVVLYKSQEGYRIETDTEDVGIGKTVDEAYTDLIDTTPGVIYLDTADFFLVSEGEETAAEDMRKYLKSGVQICAVAGQGNWKEVSKYLSVQTELVPFRKWKAGQKLPVLDCRTDRIKFM